MRAWRAACAMGTVGGALLVASACGSSDGKKSLPGGQAGESDGGGATAGGGEPGNARGGEATGAAPIVGPGGAGGAAPAAVGDACSENRDCADGLRCAYDVCVPLAACGTNDSCASDSYCDDDSFCVPYGIPANKLANPDCVRPPRLGPFEVELVCQFDTPPEDQLPASNQVMVTPSVADLDLDRDPSSVRPSLVFATYATQSWPALLTGDLRLIDGRSCELQQTLDGADEQVVSTAQPALADLDGDGRIELVMPRAPAYGGLIAFGQDDAGKYRKLWTSAVCDGVGGRTPDTVNQGREYMAGVSIHDLNDDGRPEILLGAVVYDADGCVLDATQGVVDHISGHIPVAADLDGDGAVEIATGDQLLEWHDDALEPDPSFAGTHARGYTAVADFGDFGEGPGVADIAVISAGSARIENVEGDVVFGPFTVAGLAQGGPPTIGDFDGDGKPELAAAGSSVYAVFDLDCDADPLPSECQARGLRWAKPSRDLTSNVTGSSVFDFEGDGAAEAVYADECFLRVYDGATGAVKWSIARSSGTANEYPLVADVDGDFHSELVVGTNEWPSGCSGDDPLFPSSAFVASHGVYVYRSVHDDWAGSRTIWNQHAYSITNVGDDGTVPRTSEWQANFTTPGLDNFRQNSQATLAPLAAPDLTVSCATPRCDAKGALFACQLCNRGARGVDAGVEVTFGVDEPFCSLTTDAALLPGACAPLDCRWRDPPRDEPADVTVTADPGDAVSECYERNDTLLLAGFRCE